MQVKGERVDRTRLFFGSGRTGPTSSSSRSPSGITSSFVGVPVKATTSSRSLFWPSCTIADYLLLWWVLQLLNNDFITTSAAACESVFRPFEQIEARSGRSSGQRRLSNDLLRHGRQLKGHNNQCFEGLLNAEFTSRMCHQSSTAAGVAESREILALRQRRIPRAYPYPSAASQTCELRSLTPAFPAATTSPVRKLPADISVTPSDLFQRRNRRPYAGLRVGVRQRRTTLHPLPPCCCPDTSGLDCASVSLGLQNSRSKRR